MTMPAGARPAGVVALVYLMATLPLAFVAGLRGGSWSGLALHVMLVAGTAMAAFASAPRQLRGVYAWLPLVIVPVLYAELPFLMTAAGGNYADAVVQRWERALFGYPATELAASMPWLWVSEPLHLAYFLYYPLIYVPPLVLFLRGAHDDFEQAVTALVGTFVLCFAIFTVFPVQGPRYLVGSPAPPGWMRETVLRVLEAGSSRGAAFPSSHVAVAVAQVGMAWRRGSRLTPVYGMVTLLLAAGAVYGGFHYAVDAVAGVIVGLAVVAAAPGLVRLARHPFRRPGV